MTNLSHPDSAADLIIRLANALHAAFDYAQGAPIGDPGAWNETCAEIGATRQAVADWLASPFRRNVDVTGSGTLAEAMGCNLERMVLLENFVEGLIQEGASLARVVTALNERGDLTDSEWTAAIYALGYHVCSLERGVGK